MYQFTLGLERSVRGRNAIPLPEAVSLVLESHIEPFAQAPAGWTSDARMQAAGDASAESDDAFMALALAEARRAQEADEVPIGAIVVLDGRVLARAHNLTGKSCDPTAHAEILAVRAAALAVGAIRLPGATVYTTVEPCFMCAGALSHARIARVVWAVRDPKFGGCASLGNVLTDPRLNHRMSYKEDVRADEARRMMQEFFRAKRSSGG